MAEETERTGVVESQKVLLEMACVYEPFEGMAALAFGAGGVFADHPLGILLLSCQLLVYFSMTFPFSLQTYPSIFAKQDYGCQCPSSREGS